ncbi:SusC/RagA family TonB-linked outer membrane protein [Flammeovirgaceae bacterium SG7u.111]|nr:SusC/RagA family TonB-linked outer membrane protein [Flammeovirgaceae bacterium SG7u.132]WPO37445.1 SusC/RagA family TonB-linked outer membrane protein [Flammeovirgaceae bacterium SG7u.111]
MLKHVRNFMFLLSMMCFGFAQAQDKSVSGTVTSAEDDTALPGVSVVIKGSGTGTITDIDGKFRLNAPANAILVFSYIGFEKQEVEVGGQTSFNVVMQVSEKVLSEVVVTAVGIEREKKALGYAVTDLDGDVLSQKSEPDPVRALQGKVAGVNIVGGGGAVGAGTNITIRGNSSLLGNNQPLFVVDGVPFDNSSFQTGSFASGTTTSSSRSFDIDPNNIESMTVLKGAAASALYGSRAANGVIVITTKAGRKGTKKGFEIAVNSSYSVEEVSNLPEYQTQYTQGNNFKYVDGNFGTWGATFDTSNPMWEHPLNANTLVGTDAEGRPLVKHPYDRYPTRFPELVDATVPLQAYNTPKDFFQTGHVAETGVTISGGGEKANITTGISYMKNVGIVPNNEATRIGLNIGGNAELDNGLIISGTINYVKTDLTSPPMAGLGTGGTSITERLLYTPPNVNVKGYPYEDAEGNGAFYRPDNDNPYWLANRSPHTSDVDRYFGKFSVGRDITDWLNVTYQAGFNAYTDRRVNVVPSGSVNFPTGTITTDNIYRNEIDGNLLITIQKDLTEDINLKFIGGHNANQRVVDRNSQTGTGIIVRGIDNLLNTQSVIPNGGYYQQQRYHAFFGDLSASYRDWAFLNVTGRNEWHSGLPKDAQSFFYPSVSSSIIFTDALKMNSSILNFGKIRAGFATTGNDVDPYQTSTVYVTNSALGNNIASLDFPFASQNVQSLSNTIGNQGLRPEITREFELGTDLKFFKDRIGLEFTYYKRSSKDQIVPIEVAPTSGYRFAVANIGEVTNEGIEIGLDVTPVELANGFRWNIFGVFTKNENLVKEIGSGLSEVFVGGYGNAVRVMHREGLPYGQIVGTVAARADDGQLLIDPATGKLIEKTEPEVIGDPNPDFILGVTNTFSFKGFSLNFLIDYRHGGDMYSDTYTQVYGRGLSQETIPDGPRGREITVVIPGVEGDPSTQQAVLDDSGNMIPNGRMLTVNDWYFINTFGSAGPEEFAVFDATTIRLRELTLSYAFPKTLLDKTPFGSANISLTGRNLWYKAVNFPKSLNFDPETSSLGAGNVQNLGGSSDGSGNAQGIDFGIVPTTRRYGVNLRFTF